MPQKLTSVAPETNMCVPQLHGRHSRKVAIRKCVVHRRLGPATCALHIFSTRLSPRLPTHRAVEVHEIPCVKQYHASRCSQAGPGPSRMHVRDIDMMGMTSHIIPPHLNVDSNCKCSLTCRAWPGDCTELVRDTCIFQGCHASNDVNWGSTVPHGPAEPIQLNSIDMAKFPSMRLTDAVTTFAFQGHLLMYAVLLGTMSYVCVSASLPRSSYW